MGFQRKELKYYQDSVTPDCSKAFLEDPALPDRPPFPSPVVAHCPGASNSWALAAGCLLPLLTEAVHCPRGGGGSVFLGFTGATHVGQRLCPPLLAPPQPPSACPSLLPSLENGSKRASSASVRGPRAGELDASSVLPQLKRRSRASWAGLDGGGSAVEPIIGDIHARSCHSQLSNTITLSLTPCGAQGHRQAHSSYGLYPFYR